MKNKLTVANKLVISFSVIIAMFVGVVVYTHISYREINQLHGYLDNQLNLRTVQILSAHQEFTELRFLSMTSFLNPAFRTNAGPEEWRENELRILDGFGRINESVRAYYFSFGGEPWLTDAEIEYRVNVTHNILNDLVFWERYFIDGAFNRGDISVLLSGIGYRSANIEENLTALIDLTAETSANVLVYIEETSIRILGITIGISLTAIMMAAMLAWTIIDSIKAMAIEKEQEAHSLNKTILESAPICINIMDTERNELICNRTTLKMFGMEEPVLTPDEFAQFMPEHQPDGAVSADILAELMEKAHIKGKARTEWTAMSASGEILPTEVFMVSHEHMGRKLLLVYLIDMRDVVASKEAERDAWISQRRIEEQARLASEASLAKTRFLAHMSHEIRTPLNAVMGITEIQLQKNNVSQETEDAFLRIYNSSSLLLAIINDILDLSKVEAGKMQIINSTYEMASMIVDTVQLNLMHIGSKQIDFSLNVDENLPAYLIGDELRIKQILNNLLSNAFKYTYKGFVKLNISYERSADNPNGILLQFSVEDSGQGMTEEQIEGLFGVEFLRYNMRTNRSIEGSGLGMNIAGQLIAMMGGDIDVQSEPKVGSTFTARIPQEIDSTAVLGKEAARNLENLEVAQKELKRINKLKRIPMPYGNVLVVDDVESNLFVAKGLLLPYKLSIETVDSGQTALTKIESGAEYDIIFMDHMMPEMDGIEAVKRIRAAGYSKPIVALTANAIVGQADLFLQNGFDGFIAKPIDVNQLNSYLIRFVRDAHPIEAMALAEDELVDPYEINTEVTADLTASFLRDIEKVVDILEQEPLGRKALKQYTVHVHGMKSVLTNLKKHELSKVALNLEQAGKTIQVVTPLFLGDLKQVAIDLNEQLEKSAAGHQTITMPSTDTMREHFGLLAEACEEFDIKSAEKILAGLRQSAAAEHIKLLDSIAENLLSGHFDRAAELAAGAV